MRHQSFMLDVLIHFSPVPTNILPSTMLPVGPELYQSFIQDVIFVKTPKVNTYWSSDFLVRKCIQL